MLFALGATSCAGGAETAKVTGPQHRPHVLALSAYEASLGTVIDAYGDHLPADLRSDLSLVFSGTFTSEDQTQAQVDLEVPVKRVDSGTVRWTSFGPYGN